MNRGTFRQGILFSVESGWIVKDQWTFHFYFQFNALKCLRGENVLISVCNMVHFFLTDEGMLHFTLKGTDKKRKFEPTKMYKLISGKY